jgi:hypothetical protein
MPNDRFENVTAIKKIRLQRNCYSSRMAELLRGLCQRGSRCLARRAN